MPNKYRESHQVVLKEAEGERTEESGTRRKEMKEKEAEGRK